MTCKVHVFGPSNSQPTSGLVVDVTSQGKDDFRFLSPFLLEPTGGQAKNVENLWQYSKLYKEYADTAGNPTTAFYTWRDAGFAKNIADRYPRGKGAKPLCSIWHGEKLDYLSARRKIYEPQYRAAALAHCSGQIEKLKQMTQIYRDIYLFDFDGYDHLAYDMTLAEVGRNVERPMGHAFIVASLITGEPIF
jgi:hypothetical protein